MPDPIKEADSDLALSAGPRATLRFSQNMWDRVEAAAQIVSRRIGREIEASSFFRDEGMTRINEICASDPATSARFGLDAASVGG